MSCCQRGDGDNEILIQFQLACKADSVGYHILFNLAIAAIAGVILMQISAEQMPFLDRVAPRCVKLVTCKFWPFMLMTALMSSIADCAVPFFCADFHFINP